MKWVDGIYEDSMEVGLCRDTDTGWNGMTLRIQQLSDGAASGEVEINFDLESAELGTEEEAKSWCIETARNILTEALAELEEE